MSESFQLDGPDHFTAGAIGAPGQRVFYLQAREGRALVTLKCEKEHVAALGEYLAGLIAKLPAAATPPAAAPAAAAPGGLLEPIEAAWPVASLGVGYDEGRDRIVVVANEQVEEEEEEGGPPAAEPASARFAITRGQAAAFVERARALVKAGRATCPMCGEPKDPAGHVCPRANGHVVRKE
jgi:uncharacterized repeat protein (TIGR03847 family)